MDAHHMRRYPNWRREHGRGFGSSRKTKGADMDSGAGNSFHGGDFRGGHLPTDFQSSRSGFQLPRGFRDQIFIGDAYSGGFVDHHQTGIG